MKELQLPAIQNLTLLRSRVLALLSEEYDAEQGEHAPTIASVNRASALLHDALQAGQGDFPRGFASTTGHGDIRMYWRSDEQEIHLTIPTDTEAPPTLYIYDHGRERLIREASVQMLADALSTFVNT